MNPNMYNWNLNWSSDLLESWELHWKAVQATAEAALAWITSMRAWGIK